VEDYHKQSSESIKVMAVIDTLVRSIERSKNIKDEIVDHLENRYWTNSCLLLTLMMCIIYIKDLISTTGANLNPILFFPIKIVI